MGVANHAPGLPVMGAASRSKHPLMGGADVGPQIGVMGTGDQGARISLLGNSNPAFLDSLFAPLAGAAARCFAGEPRPRPTTGARSGIGHRGPGRARSR
jgi:hypothetical protein